MTVKAERPEGGVGTLAKQLSKAWDTVKHSSPVHNYLYGPQGLGHAFVDASLFSVPAGLALQAGVPGIVAPAAVLSGLFISLRGSPIGSGALGVFTGMLMASGVEPPAIIAASVISLGSTFFTASRTVDNRSPCHKSHDLSFKHVLLGAALGTALSTAIAYHTFPADYAPQTSQGKIEIRSAGACRDSLAEQLSKDPRGQTLAIPEDCVIKLR